MIVKHDQDLQKFVLILDVDPGRSVKVEGGELQYNIIGASIDLFHTEVPTKYKGMGHGDKLIDAAIAFSNTRQLRIIPSCTFVRHVLEKRAKANM